MQWLLQTYSSLKTKIGKINIANAMHLQKASDLASNLSIISCECGPLKWTDHSFGQPNWPDARNSYVDPDTISEWTQQPRASGQLSSPSRPTELALSVHPKTCSQFVYEVQSVLDVCIAYLKW